jgi:PAS domain S-box-containing protein
MEFDQSFLKQLSILYIEDDLNIRDSFSKLFTKLFKKVIIAIDGQDGLDKFQETHSSEPFNIIISDINMPRLNGIELLRKIKEIDNNIPFIFTTAFTESQYLLEAINLGVTHYAVKPIEIKQLLLQVQDICSEKYAIEQLKKTEKTNATYLNIINKVAVVSQTDLHGDITFVNDIFCEVSGYTKEELLGANQRIVRHPDMPTSFFDNLWDTLRAGNVWHGKIKNKAKDGSSYYVDAHIFPIYDAKDESMEGWMAVRFLITESELEKQKFYKNVLSNIKEQKLHNAELKQQIHDMENKKFISENIDILMDQLENERMQSKKLKQFLNDVEHENRSLNEKMDKLVKDSNEKNSDLNTLRQKFQEKITEQEFALESLKRENQEYLHTIDSLAKEKGVKDKRIHELLDVIKHLDKKLKK